MKRTAKNEADKEMGTISLNSSDGLIEEGNGNAVTTISGDSRPPTEINRVKILSSGSIPSADTGSF